MKFNLKFKNLLFLGWALSFSALSHATLPMAHIKGVDDLFLPEYKIYSPLTGLLQHETFVSKEYASHNEEPIGKLLSILFTRIVDAEVAPSHLRSNPSSNLTASTTAKIFLKFEEIKAKDLPSIERKKQLEEQLKQVIVSDEGYLDGLKQAQKNIETAEMRYEEFQRTLDAEKEKSEQAQIYNKEVLSPLIAQVKNLTRKLKKLAEVTSELQDELSNAEKGRDQAQANYDEMSKGLITTRQKDEAKKELKHQRSDNDVTSASYQTKLDTFVETLALCFSSYELKQMDPSPYPYGTTVLLLSHLWTKNTTKEDLKGYIETLASVGAITGAGSGSDSKIVNKKLLSELKPDFYTDYYSQNDYDRLRESFPRWSLFNSNQEVWVRNHFVDALAMSTDSSGGSKLPQVLQFSYWKWILYTIIPDCCESAIHNIINLIAYNPDTGKFDYRILEQLKNKYYPNMSEKLIEYYRKYSDYSQHDSSVAGSEWLDLVSGLNEGHESLPSEQLIVYSWNGRREVDGPNSNLFKVVSRLLGYENVEKDSMAEIFSRVKEVSGFDVSYKNETPNEKNMMSASFRVGKNAFVLNSYGSYHVTYNLIKDKGDALSRRLADILNSEADAHKNKSLAEIFRYDAAHRYLNRL